MILSAYPEVAVGRGGSDGSCCPCPPGPKSTPEPYSQTTTTQFPIKTKTPINNYLKRARRAIPPWAVGVKRPHKRSFCWCPFCSANQCTRCPSGPNRTPEQYSQTTTTQFPIKTKTPIYNFLKRGRRAIPPWLLHDIS